MKKPVTLQEAHDVLAKLAADNPIAVLLAMVDQLVDLAAAGGNPIHGPLHDLKKLKFYQSVIARLVLGGEVKL